MKAAVGFSGVARTTSEARRTYDRLARWYDLISGASEGRLIAEGVADLSPQPGETVLEIGCGTGRGLVLLALAVGNEGRVYAADVSARMIDVARARVERAGFKPRVELGQGDGRLLPYIGGAFDAVFMSFTLELFETRDIPVVLRECLRVLRPGGRLGVVALSREGRLGAAVRVYEWFHDKIPSLVDCRPILVKTSICEAGFVILSEAQRSIAGLPIGIVTARVPAS